MRNEDEVQDGIRREKDKGKAKAQDTNHHPPPPHPPPEEEAEEMDWAGVVERTERIEREAHLARHTTVRGAQPPL